MRQIEEVARYCESDVFNTYRVWLVYELFRGAITAEQLPGARRRYVNSSLLGSQPIRIYVRPSRLKRVRREK